MYAIQAILIFIIIQQISHCENKPRIGKIFMALFGKSATVNATRF